MKTKLAIAGAALLLTGTPASAQSTTLPVLTTVLHTITQVASGNRRERSDAIKVLPDVISALTTVMEHEKQEQELARARNDALLESKSSVAQNLSRTAHYGGGHYHRDNLELCDYMQSHDLKGRRPGLWYAYCEMRAPQPVQQCPAADCSQVAEDAAEQLVATKRQLEAAQERIANMAPRLAALEAFEQRVIPWLRDIPITGKNRDELANYGSKQAYDALAEHAPEIGAWQDEQR